MFKSIGKLLALALLGSTVLGASAQAGNEAQRLDVPVGSHRLLPQQQAVGRVAIGDPKIADVNLVNSHELLVTGKSVGSTSLYVWSRAAMRKSAGMPTEYQIGVGVPGVPTQDLGGAQVNPGASVSGTVPNLLAHRDATLAAEPPAKGKPADFSMVAADSQVLTNIQIVEVQKSVINQFGLNFLKTTNTVGALGVPGTLGGGSLDASGNLIPQSGAGFLPIQNAFGILVGGKGIYGLLSVLEGNNLARVLAEPSLTAMSGQTATFLAGGEFPVPVVQGGGGSNGNQAITIQYKQFGVRVSLTPTVLSPNDISLKVAPEVSDLDYNNAITISGTTVPALTVRRTETTVQLGDGQSFVISGLISNNLIKNVNKIPWLGNIPILGAFFRSSDFERQQKELIMIVTPHLVKPIAAGAKMPALPGAETDNDKLDFGQMVFGVGGDGTGYSH